MEAKTILCTAFVVLLSVLAVTDGAKWSYSGNSGPKHWHELFKHQCSGENQSPVDLRPEQTIYDPALKDFAIWYDPPRPGSEIIAQNNGHALKVELNGEFFVTNGGLPGVFKAAQFHFHWGHKSHHGSEHLIDGVASPIEMHLVTYDQEKYKHIGEAVQKKDGLAVLGVMFEISEENNTAFDTIVRAIKLVRNPEEKRSIRLPLDSVSIRDVLPADTSRYYRYRGSLTTPDCFESVIWTVFDQKQTLSRAQLREFRSMLQPRRRHHHHHHNKHHGDSEAGHARHRRSLAREEIRKENRAMGVLEELGIKGNAREEAFLRDATIKHNELMQADSPQEPNASGQDAQINTIEVVTKSEAKPVIQEGGAVENQSQEPTPDAGQVTPVTQEPPTKVSYIQDPLVNNYRPVQPLNDRIAYRSFKLRETVVVLPEPASGQYKVDRGDTSSSSKAHDCDCDGAASLWASALVILASLLLSAFFVL